MKLLSSILLFLQLFFSCKSNAQEQPANDSLKTLPGPHLLRDTWDTLVFKGQFSTWINYNLQNKIPLWVGGRYLPQLNYDRKYPEGKRLDFEGSLNISGQAGMHPFDSISGNGSMRPYRIWSRYSTKQLEVRLGLQKINFGPATLLRPLMWFDQIDPRDPLQITNGVYGLLGRYYFLKNANIWLWGLYGNNKPKTWEISGTSRRYPELGGRFQTPFRKGEVAVSGHFRMTDMRALGYALPEVPEHRIGLDGKWDLGIGVWFEAVWMHKGRNVGVLTNQQIITVGTDYTFGIGNGLNVVFEQFLASHDEKALAFSNIITMSAASFAYPLGMFDNLSAIIYYDWINNSTHNFINWKRQFKRSYLYIMAYLNPENSRLPQQNGSANLFSGPGIQVMLVYNH